MPSFADVRLVPDRLDAVLRARPDIAEDLARAVAACADAETVNEVRAALGGDSAAWGALTLAAAAAYFLSPSVLAKLDYQPPSARWEIGELETEAVDLLDRVRAREPTYTAASSRA